MLWMRLPSIPASLTTESLYLDLLLVLMSVFQLQVSVVLQHMSLKRDTF